MNKSEVETFKDIKKIVEDNTKILVRLDKSLNGDPDDRKDFGLRGDVRNNLKWKHNVNKALGFLAVTSVGLLGRQLLEYFKR